METTVAPYLLDLQFRGFIEGLTIKAKNTGKILCRYFGGIPYALPPVGPYRWRKPRSLPACYRYGTRANPGRYTGKTGICPQPGKSNPLFDEDCLQCNIWVPAGKPPEKGWPVFFFIHGGFLQYGTANGWNPAALLGETDCKCIFVIPAYRLNVFGFLASRELQQESTPDGSVGNLGFWDQRLALQWTRNNISYFGGDASNITVGGYSAGAHSAFHQLAYDLALPESKSIIRRVIMWSNGPGLQPKSLSEVQEQFDELLHALNIPLDLPTKDKLSRLRSMKPQALLAATKRMKHHQFRAVTDKSFVRHTLFQEIDDGTFARQMRHRGIKLLIGECAEEHFVYGAWHAPHNSLTGLFERLRVDYSRAACQVLLKHYCPDGQLPRGSKDWYDAFGRIYADVQIHRLERGFVDAMARHGAGDLVYRYRIEWRAKCVDSVLPREWGVTHGSDIAIWFWGNGQMLEEEEKEVVRKAFIGPLARFLRGEEVEWGTKGPLEVRRLTSGGEVDVWKDGMWNKGVELWRLLHSEKSSNLARRAKL